MCLYCLRSCHPWVLPPSLRRWPRSLTSPLPSLLGGVGGAIELVLGADNIHFFPCRVGSKNNSDMSIVLFESKLQGGLVFGGSVSTSWRSRMSMSRKAPVMISLMGLMMALVFCLAAPAQAFIAYDCVNGSNVVEAYSLLEPAQCSVSGFEHRYEHTVHVEIVQQKRERTVSIFRCHVVESVFSQYCGHSSDAALRSIYAFVSRFWWSQRHAGGRR
jgi:hypothetical protein